MQSQQLNNKKGTPETLQPVRVVRTPRVTEFYNFKVGCSFLFLCCSSRI
jgi:hypothetical protein